MPGCSSGPSLEHQSIKCVHILPIVHVRLVYQMCPHPSYSSCLLYPCPFGPSNLFTDEHVQPHLLPRKVTSKTEHHASGSVIMRHHKHVQSHVCSVIMRHHKHVQSYNIIINISDIIADISDIIIDQCMISCSLFSNRWRFEKTLLKPFPSQTFSGIIALI